MIYGLQNWRALLSIVLSRISPSTTEGKMVRPILNSIVVQLLVLITVWQSMIKYIILALLTNISRFSIKHKWGIMFVTCPLYWKRLDTFKIDGWFNREEDWKGCDQIRWVFTSYWKVKHRVGQSFMRSLILSIWANNQLLNQC